MDKNGKVSGTPVWLSIEEMELIVKRLPKASQGPQWKTIDELWVCLLYTSDAADE